MQRRPLGWCRPPLWCQNSADQRHRAWPRPSFGARRRCRHLHLAGTAFSPGPWAGPQRRLSWARLDRLRRAYPPRPRPDRAHRSRQRLGDTSPARQTRLGQTFRGRLSCPSNSTGTSFRSQFHHCLPAPEDVLHHSGAPTRFKALFLHSFRPGACVRLRLGRKICQFFAKAHGPQHTQR